MTKQEILQHIRDEQHFKFDSLEDGNNAVDIINDLRKNGNIKYGEYEMPQLIPRNFIFNISQFVILKSLDDSEENF